MKTCRSSKKTKKVFNLALIFLSGFIFLFSNRWAWGEWDSDHENLVDSAHEQESKGGFDKDRDWDDAVGREKWLRRGHKSPDGHPSAWHHQQARIHARSMPVIIPHYVAPPFVPAGGAGGVSPMGVPIPAGAPSGSSCDWNSIGPKPLSIASPYGFTSGLVDTIAVDTVNDPTGNTMYLGACRGGVWETTNGLSASPTYTLLSDPHQTLSVGAIGLDTSVNPPILYVGTGDYNGDDWFGEGIFKSTDGGNTWTLTSTANAGAISLYGMTFSKIMVDPVNPNIVLACTADNGGGDPGGPFPTRFGLYRSTNSGTTWTKVTTVTSGTALGNNGFQDLTYDSSTATYYAAVNGTGVYKSTNQGASWAQTTTPFASGTAVSAANFTRVCVAARAGKLWCLMVAGNVLSTPVTATDTGLSESDDGGNTWSAVSLANTLASGLWYQAGYDLYVAAPPNSTTVLIANIDVWGATPNGMSTTWTDLTNSFNNGIVHCDQHAIAFAGPATWYVGNDGGVWSTTNAGTSWHDINTNLDTVLFYHVAADPNNTGYFLGGAQDNGTSATKNQGVTWHEIAGSDGSCVGANLGTPGQYFAEYYNVSLLISANYGGTWPDGVGNPPITDQSAFFVPFKVVQGAPASVLLGTTRIWEGPANTAGGTGWNPISPNFTTNVITALDVAASNPNVIYAVTADPQVDVTTNGGGTWTNVTGSLLPKLFYIVNCITVDPTNPAQAYIAFQQITGSSAGHIYVTSNTGTTWTDIGGNLPDAPVNWVLVDPEVPTDVYVATDVGVFMTQDVNGSGTVWSQLGTQLPDTTILTLDISHTCPRVVVAGTYGRSAWAICPVDSGTCATNTPTATPLGTSTSTPTSSPTNTLTSTTTRTMTSSPTNTATPSATASLTLTATLTPTWTSSSTASRTPTLTPFSTNTPTNTITETITHTMTASPTNTVTASATASPTLTATLTSTGTSSSTPSGTPTLTVTNSPTATPTFSPTPTFTGTTPPTSTATNSPTRTTTDTPTLTTTSTSTHSPTLTPSFTPTQVTVSVTTGPAAPPNSTQLPGATNVGVVQVLFSNPSASAVTVNSLTLADSGSGTPSIAITGIALFNNGISLGTTTFSGATAAFTSLNLVIPAGASVTLQVNTNFSGGAPGATTYQFSISSVAGTNGQPVLFTGIPYTGAAVTIASATLTPTFTASPTSSVPLASLTPTSSPTPNGQVVIYPNPVGDGPVHILFPSYPGVSDVKVAFYTLAFRKIKEADFADAPSGTTVLLDLTDNWGTPLANGLYYVVVTTSQGRSIGRLLILR